MKHRLFIAIDLPPTSKMEILSLQQKLERLRLPVEWEPAEKLHLTLNFLGAVPEEAILPIKSRISPVIQSYSPFKLIPFFLETLYNKHAPSLIYLAPQGDLEILKSLQKDLRSVLNDMRYPQANRFLPHFTVGRFKKADPVSTKTFLDQVKEFDFSPLTPFMVDRVHIIESHLSRQGSTYQKVAQFRL